MLWYIWMIIGFVLCVLEVFTPGFFILLPGAAAIVTGVIAIFTPLLEVQLIVFLVLSVLLIIFLRPFVLKTMARNEKPTNADGMIGKTVLVTEDIDNQQDKGYIKYYSDHFPARAEKGGSFAKGEVVKIVRIDGIKVFVEAAGVSDESAIEGKSK